MNDTVRVVQPYFTGAFAEAGESIIHPAWLAVLEIMKDADRWEDRAMGKVSGYADWQIYVAMALKGYADDVIVYEDEGKQKFVFPALFIPVDENDGESGL